MGCFHGHQCLTAQVSGGEQEDEAPEKDKENEERGDGAREQGEGGVEGAEGVRERGGEGGGRGS